MTVANLAKNLVQSKAVNMVKLYQYIVLEWATGCGKTLAALKMIEEVRRINPKSKGLLVFKESTHKKNWLEDIKKHNMDHILKNTEIILYASLHKVSESYYDFIVLDECHGLTWKRLEHLHKIIIPTTKLFLLSATIPSDKKYLIEKLVNNKFVKYATISLDQAIKREMLPKPTIYVHQVNLNSADKLKYNNLQKQIVYFQRKNMFGPTKVSGLKRKKLIANSKTVCAKRIIALFKAKKYRFICFANDIKQAKLLALPKPVVCSKEQSAKFNQSLVDAFNRQQGDSLFAVKMLRESVNLTEIDRGLIIQLDKEPLSFYQMLGRCLRSKNPEMHMILCKDTHDQIYFDNVMDKSLLKYVVYV